MSDPSWNNLNNREISRTRAHSEDIPMIVQELLNDLPDETQTILRVSDTFPFDSKDKKEAEENYLNNKNTDKLLQDSKNCYDYVFLRRLLKSSPLDSLYTSRKYNDVKSRPVVEVSHRSFEEEFLREPKKMNDHALKETIVKANSLVQQMKVLFYENI